MVTCRRISLLLRALPLLVAGALPLGCSPKPAAGPDAIAATNQRLQGDWRVLSFTPESALDPPLQGLINAQLGAMTLSLVGNSYHATGPGLDIQGRFELKSSANDLFEALIYDSSNVSYRISGQISGGTLNFRCYDSPWRGTGSLARPQQK